VNLQGTHTHTHARARSCTPAVPRLGAHPHLACWSHVTRASGAPAARQVLNTIYDTINSVIQG
jgi:hypothetical protein